MGTMTIEWSERGATYSRLVAQEKTNCRPDLGPNVSRKVRAGSINHAMTQKRQDLTHSDNYNDIVGLAGTKGELVVGLKCRE